MNNRIQRSGLNSIDDTVNEIKGTLNGLKRNLIVAPSTESAIQIKSHLRIILVNLNRLKTAIPSNVYCECVDLFKEVHKLVVNDESDQKESNPYHIPKIKTPGKGNNAFDINKDHLEYLLKLGLSVTNIAKNGLLGQKIHYNTLYKYMKKSNIPSQQQRYSTMNDANLKVVISRIVERFPNSGIREVVAHLQTQEPPIIVQRDRIGKLLPEINPVGTSMRWAQTIKRRSYSVRTPNSLWHIDTHHALVKWNLIVDGAIDGFSRLIPYLKVNSDNLSTSALTDFISGLKEYGVPSRVRADKGSEFVHINKLMIAINGEDRGSFIQGKSVHNQRIERLWRDVYTKVIDKYYRLFHLMADKGLLDADIPTHISCLQYVFLPRIQDDLDLWRKAHNYHKMRLEKNGSPLQLWYTGSHINEHKESTAMENLFRRPASDFDSVITEFEDSCLDEPADIKIVLPRYPLPLTDRELDTLKQTINVKRESSSHGIDIYGDVLRYVSERCTE